MTDAVEGRLAALADVELPVATLAEVSLHLRRPFAAEAVRWKVQNEWGRGAVVVAYIDARLVVERLNTVCPTMWETRYEPAGAGALRCHLTLTGPYEQLDPPARLSTPRSITRSDVGVGQGRSEGDKLKAANSDALKRAAVQFGIGVSIYAMRAVQMDVGQGPNKLRTVEKTKKIRGDEKKVPVPVLERENEMWLAERYGAWLEAKGLRLFGPALDHGDEAGATGMDETPALVVAAEQDAAAEAGDEAAGDGFPAALEDDRAKELKLQAEGWYARLRRVAPRKLPPKAFQTQLRQALGAHETLEAFVAGLEGLVLENEAKP